MRPESTWDTLLISAGDTQSDALFGLSGSSCSPGTGLREARVSTSLSCLRRHFSFQPANPCAIASVLDNSNNRLSRSLTQLGWGYQYVFIWGIILCLVLCIRNSKASSGFLTGNNPTCYFTFFHFFDKLCSSRTFSELCVSSLTSSIKSHPNGIVKNCSGCF